MLRFGHGPRIRPQSPRPRGRDSPTPHLDRGHTIFGEVVKGFDLVPKIARAGNARTRLEQVTITRGAQP